VTVKPDLSAIEIAKMRRKHNCYILKIEKEPGK
jgi:hypothetical protein